MIPLGYNTNGFPGHRLDDAVRILADLGYAGVALTPDVHHLDPFRSTPRDVDRFRNLLESKGMWVVIETGARFLLDPRRKHHPALLSREYGMRQDFLQRCIDLARDLGAPLISTWSGAGEEGIPEERQIRLLAERLAPVCDHGRDQGVQVAIEPEPGMLVEGMAEFARLVEAAGPDRAPWLTLDVGHAAITETEPPEAVLRRWKDRVLNVHLDDVAGRRHEHLPPGTGEIDFAPILDVLESLDREIRVSLELSRSGHDAVEQARRAIGFLAGCRG